ncbi:MAG: cytochrome bd ubiquinol oxidase subunit [Tenuifilum sp.]|jgi:cytochrome d ubiquinol oxidase subunit II|uniref:cytochrome d ubiquinol oxidase subunit II n=1 Tax=Tenuifilum sp. TaxID=2760880 RepID=UPI0024AABCA8|nr:cytochrome d ubiquinol oxidase subunit II [Tenuifilum sp.]MDI3527428.1 cytochrome bd ubiquinol oxidase subunit [Tenuifilum sp.]
MVDTTYILLQHYWWFIISLLGALLVFLLFVQGGQTLIYTLGKTEMERTMLVNALGRKWEFTFTTLVTFGGAFFASFPLFYSTSFGGAYWVWMAILFCFVIQAVSYEYRSKPNNFLGPKTFEIFLFINGLLGTVLLGTAVATFFTGSEFSVAKINLTNLSNPVISSWETPWHGLEAALNLHNLSLGLAVFFLARVLAILYFMNSIDHDEIFARAKKHLLYNAIPFLVFFLTFVIWLLIRDGFALNPETNEIFMQEHKYLLNLIQMPIVLVLFLAGVVLVLWGIAKSILKTYTKGIWFAGIGTVLTVLSLFLIAGYNNTAYYPSTFNLQHSLTIFNSSSSKFTLTVMSVVSILVPFVVAYIWYAWKSINNKKIDEEEMKNETHVY